ncbi:hypothetical protein AK812_SmicGene17508 [Symbiodinium microadriaticum]|uniref:Uncharacterized protein n=1 Tax=Symbiodinium microadriaticum TaxID=2951 RepID=A0A1Q9DXI7_SYMMI|nr:hypothetical protein AK812_SmicGene17508 [Symbiodinium microadriaticum]CAE7231952.1 unnamed protein product [Symbiodinium microadriaticum]CAE7308293.1 unnamed protein product [Symbiodinium sp. KB8]
MECSRCRGKMSSSDFPDPVSDCEHAPSICLTCLDNLLPKDKHLSGMCPECGKFLPESEIQKIRRMMKHCNRECAVFRDLDLLGAREEEVKRQRDLGVDSLPPEGNVEVSVLDGRRLTLSLSKRMRLSAVKEKIRNGLNVPEGKQRLLFRGRDLTANQADDPQWSSLGVPFGEVIQLVIIMYETGSTSSASAVRKLTFELSWTAVPTRLKSGKITTHHLNGSCIQLDSACNVLGEVDFQATRSSGITHGGPSSIRNPRQLITVDTTLLASTCRYLFFTLSAFKPGGVTLESFQNPSVRLKNAVSMQQLASYNASRSGREEAVVLCCAVKDQISGNWRVQETGVRSDGNAKMYGPLHTTVRQLVLGGKV